jgi:putative colanic acid biosysnthesis UDP-glucose lipid carrier transferase
MAKKDFGRRRAPSRISYLFPIADTLLGAAHSDEDVPVSEYDVIYDILCEILHVDVLPERLEKRLEEFDPTELNLTVIGSEMENSKVMGRRTLLELTHAVCEATGEIDLREDRYMLALAVALSLQPEEYDDLVFDSPFHGWRAVLKRLQDIILGTIFLLLSLIPMVVIAAAIKVSSRGPIFFRQRRYGENGKEFKMLKFRSMTVVEDGGVVTQAKREDPRITRVGKFIRRTSLDELPQFINVIKGDMSVVGPRPHAVAHNELYRKQILEYMRRHKVKPGITGWAQVNGHRGETDTIEKMVKRVEHDLFYIRHWRFGLDICIIWQTIFGTKTRENAF